MSEHTSSEYPGDAADLASIARFVVAEIEGIGCCYRIDTDGELFSVYVSSGPARKRLAADLTWVAAMMLVTSETANDMIVEGFDPDQVGDMSDEQLDESSSIHRPSRHP